MYGDFLIARISEHDKFVGSIPLILEVSKEKYRYIQNHFFIQYFKITGAWL